ncbi:hypothetical protein D3C72_1324020 [compost metagenome]
MRAFGQRTHQQIPLGQNLPGSMLEPQRVGCRLQRAIALDEQRVAGDLAQPGEAIGYGRDTALGAGRHRVEVPILHQQDKDVQKLGADVPHADFSRSRLLILFFVGTTEVATSCLCGRGLKSASAPPCRTKPKLPGLMNYQRAGKCKGSRVARVTEICSACHEFVAQLQIVAWRVAVSSGPLLPQAGWRRQ